MSRDGDRSQPSLPDTLTFWKPPHGAVVFDQSTTPCPQCGVVLSFDTPAGVVGLPDLEPEVQHREELGVQHVIVFWAKPHQGERIPMARVPGRSLLAARIQARRRHGQTVED